MSVYQKLNDARAEFHKLQLKKTGKNAFAGYQYFELGDFLLPAMEVFGRHGLCAIVSFERELATMRIISVDPKDAGEIIITSPMGSAALKGCHEVQNIGAVETYQRRYLWVAALEIVEHDALDATTGRDPVDKLEAAIAEPQASPPRAPLKGKYKSKTALWAAFKAFDRELRGCGDLDTLDCLIATDDAKALIAQCKDEAEALWLTGEGLPPEFEPLSTLINRMRNELQAETEFAVKGAEYVAAG
jgi:hypothetical protein